MAHYELLRITQVTGTKDHRLHAYTVEPAHMFQYSDILLSNGITTVFKNEEQAFYDRAFKVMAWAQDRDNNDLALYIARRDGKHTYKQVYYAIGEYW